MSDFMIRFLLCNLIISGIISIFLLLKRLCRNHISSRMQYNLWFFLIGLLGIPFLPFQVKGLPQMFSFLDLLMGSSGTNMPSSANEVATSTSTTTWINDFTISVSRSHSVSIGYILFEIWISGMMIMTILVLKSFHHLHYLKKSALSLQNSMIHSIYQQNLRAMGIKKEIPIFSTALLKSPVIVGLIRPRIYLPTHLISDYNQTSIYSVILTYI